MPSIKDTLKGLITMAGWQMKDVIEQLNSKYHRNESPSNLSNKLRNETIPHKEVLEILDIIGYEFKYTPKDTDK